MANVNRGPITPRNQGLGHVVGALQFTATDKLAGRVTAGAGAGEEITCTSAARSILDDATVGAILTTLGGIAYTDTRFKIGATSKDISNTDDLVISTVGFQPKAVVFLANQDSTTKASVGIDTQIASLAIANGHGYIASAWVPAADASIFAVETGTDTMKGRISAFAAGGFTLSWTKAGTPTGTIAIYYLAFR